MSFLKTENEDLRAKLINSKKENDFLRSEKTKINEYESKIAALTRENLKYASGASNHNAEIDSWKSKYYQLEANAKRYNDISQSTSAELEKLKEELQGFEALKAEFKKLNESYQCVLRTKNVLNDLLNQKDLAIEALKDQNKAAIETKDTIER